MLSQQSLATTDATSAPAASYILHATCILAGEVIYCRGELPCGWQHYTPWFLCTADCRDHQGSEQKG
ncbi:hypothetical protein ZWY2020_002876 [Hordeum vulgare]|nr:hypothetical protein ZWY2020_002876 [Hordeum vulgare]